MERTNTNSSRTYPIFIERSVQKVLLEMSSYSILSRLDTQKLSDDSLGDTPVPMPNTAVKP